jgi:glycerol-3-phosphate acyltransferase PlsY
LTLVILLAYAIGSVPFALLLARRWGAPDLRHVGSGNLGAANVLRASGVSAGILVAALDITKGALSVALARYLSDQPSAPAAAGLAAIVGHIYPVWLRFRGGKGVATACGVFSVLTPLAIGPALSIFAVTVWLTKYVSFGSVLASLALPPIAYLTGSPGAAIVTASAAATLIVFRHRSNLARLHGGQERRFGGRVIGHARDALSPPESNEGNDEQRARPMRRD